MDSNQLFEETVESNQSKARIGESIKGNITKTAQWFIPVVGLAYGCGFLIVFTFLKRFGVNTVDFVEAKYIHIGSLFLMACITLILPIRWLYIGIERWYLEENDDIDFLKFSVGSFKDMASFALKLMQPANAFLTSRLSEETQLMLSNYRSGNLSLESLHPPLLRDLNRVITDKSLYNAERFSGVKLRTETISLLEQNPEGEKLVLLNRMLLEGAFSLEISNFHKKKQENREWVKSVFKKLVSGGHSRKSIGALVDKFLWSDWQLSEQHGLHATFPVIGSAVLMMWCFALLLTFAQPDFAQKHPKLILFNLLFPLVIFALALPAGSIRISGRDFLYAKAREFLRSRRCFIRIWWVMLGPLYLLAFFYYREEFDICLPTLVSLFFVPPLGVLLGAWLGLVLWPSTEQHLVVRQRFTATHWALYPIQWALFLGQCWFFVRVIITKNLEVSLREVFVGRDWYLFAFLKELASATKHYFRSQPFPCTHFPIGGYIFIGFMLLFIFFGARNMYRIIQIKLNNLASTISIACMLGVIFYFSIVSFAIYIYPYIPASKGGGDYSMSHPVQVTFDPRFANAVPPAVTNDLQAHCMILLDANSGVVLLASTNDVGGPAEWRSGASKPTVYEIRREAIVSITHFNP